jgi:membrane protein implicated in regulation of membrane protease activity
VFLALAIVMAFFGKRLQDKGEESDQPLLNQRSAQLIGRTATLAEPINDGYGRVQIDGVHWRISGPDLPAGARVKVTSSVDSGTLAVEAAQ